MTGVSLICIFLMVLLLYILIIIRNQIESMKWNPSPNKCIKSTLNRIEKRIMWSSGWAPENRPQFSISICILMSRQLQLDYIDPSNSITHDCSSHSIVNYVEQLCRQLSRPRRNARMSEGDCGTKEICCRRVAYKAQRLIRLKIKANEIFKWRIQLTIKQIASPSHDRIRHGIMYTKDCRWF